MRPQQSGAVLASSAAFRVPFKARMEVFNCAAPILTVARVWRSSSAEVLGTSSAMMVDQLLLLHPDTPVKFGIKMANSRSWGRQFSRSARGVAIWSLCKS
jgi:hypothetical protein